MTTATHFYRFAARAIAPLLAVDGVRSVYVRRSVAAGDAHFPWSDLDMAVLMDEPSGEDLFRLWKRWRAVRTMFPRLGECQVFMPDDLVELAATDPYRASLDRRFAYVAWGERPVIPERAVDDRAAARRLVFWFQRYLPDSVRRGRLRDQSKIALEMYNALGVLEGLWPEPLATRSETESQARSAGLLTGDAFLEQPFAECCRVAESAARALSIGAPAISDAVTLDGLVILPQPASAWPDAALPGPTAVVTPVVLQMLIELHDPFLWLRYPAQLEPLGFAPPSRRAWIEAAARTARADQLRTPGFLGKEPRAVESGLALVEQVVCRLESGESIFDLAQSPSATPVETVDAYYARNFAGISSKAADIYRRARALAGD